MKSKKLNYKIFIALFFSFIMIAGIGLALFNGNNSNNANLINDTSINTINNYTIVLKNMPSGTGTYQQLLDIKDYSTYGINDNASNIAFYDSSNDTQLYAYVQNINATFTEIWIKNYNVSSQITMSVYSTSTDLFAYNGYLGNDTYSNGNKIFDYFCNFNGTVTPSGYDTAVKDTGTTESSGSYKVDNGLTLTYTTNTYQTNWVFYSTADYNTSNYAFAWYGSVFNISGITGANSGFGFDYNSGNSYFSDDGVVTDSGIYYVAGSDNISTGYDLGSGNLGTNLYITYTNNTDVFEGIAGYNGLSTYHSSGSAVNGIVPISWNIGYTDKTLSEVIHDVYIINKVTMPTYSIGKLYTATIQETGLPSGTSWTFTLNGNQYNLTASSESISLLNGTYSLSVNNVSHYTVAYNSTVIVNGANVNENVVFSPIAYYTATIQETGLPSGTAWAFIFNGNQYNITSSSYAISLIANGTYSLSVSSVKGYTDSYNSTIIVNGANVTRSVAFAIIPPSKYSVAVSETGLPSGTSWTFTFNGTSYTLTNISYDFTVLNGTYSITVNSILHYKISYNSTVIVNGANVNENVVFTFIPPEKFTVAVSETGLPSGTSWILIFNGTSYTLTNTSYDFSVLNGTYSIAVNSISGFTLTYNNPVTVNGANVNENVIFSPVNKVIGNGHYVITIIVNNPDNAFYSISINENNTVKQYNLTSSLIVIHLNNTQFPVNIAINNLKSNYVISQPVINYNIAGNYTINEKITNENDNGNYLISKYMPYMAIGLIIIVILIIGMAIVRRR